MKKFTTFLCAVMLVFSVVSTVNATVIIDSTTGWDGVFGWSGGLGQIDFIMPSSIPGSFTDTDWSITVGSDSVMSLATVWDAFSVGDEFALYVDGSDVSWTSTYTDSSGYFHGVYDDLFLGAGTHYLTLFLTALAPGFSSGSAYASFSGVEAAPVPEPSTVLLMGAGLLGLVGYNNRRRCSKKS